MNKKLWIVVGLVALFATVCGIGGYLAGSKGRTALAATSAFAETAFTAIARHYDAERVYELSSTEFRASFDKGEFQRSLDKLKEKVGVIRPGTQGKITRIGKAPIGGEEHVLAEWRIDAQGEKAPLTCEIQMINKDGQWQILSITLKSPALTGGASRLKDLPQPQPTR